MDTSNSSIQNNHSFINIAIFASGAGSNAKKIIVFFKDSAQIKVSLIVCNKQGAGVIKIAEEDNIPILQIEKERLFNGDNYLPQLLAAEINFIVLAGFLWKIPAIIIENYKNRIINIHPALLPKYGGKGMYGLRVHEAVIASGDKESGITIHYVDEHYDNGDIIFQAKCEVLKSDTANTLAEKIHHLEHENFPRVVEKCANKLLIVSKTL